MTRAEVIKELTELKGVGKSKAELLYDHGFDSVEKVRKASVKELTKVKGITEKTAKTIKDGLSEDKPKKTKKEETKQKPQKTTPKKTKEAKPEVTPSKEIKEESKAEEPVEIVEPSKDAYVVKKKPELTSEQKNLLILRKQIKKRTPRFIRQEWFRYKRIPMNWRKPHGLTSKMRMHKKYRPHVVRIGYRGPKDVRGFHPSGMQEVVVCNVMDLDKINPKTHAARINGTVGTKKRMAIAKRASELDIRILNMKV